MPADETKPPNQHSDDESLADQLEVKGLWQRRAAFKGRLFDAAGRESPVAEFQKDSLILHPPNKPLFDEGAIEEITVHVNEQGILLDEFGAPKKIPAAKYHGKPIFCLGEHKPGTLKNLVVWFDDNGQVNKLFLDGEAVTADQVLRMRNRTHDGEISNFFAPGANE